MHVVVMDRVHGDLAANARALAEALGRIPYEVRASLQVPGGGPAVVASHADEADARATAARLRTAGFEVAVVQPATIEARQREFMVRQFEIGSTGLMAETRDGRNIDLPFAEIDALVRGTRTSTSTTTATVRERKFSPVRAVATGGLMLSTTKKRKQASTTTESEGFLMVYAADRSPLAMFEGGLVYQSLGAAMQPARAANFAHVVSELRRLAPTAAFDDRLMRLAVQNQILGHGFNLDDRLDLAVALVAASLLAARPVA